MLNKLLSVKAKSKKRVGRGMGSGKGSHTVGRGQKGQKTRRKIHPLFEGTKVKKSLIQRLPLLRGKGKLKSLNFNPIAIDVNSLEVLPENTKVDIAALIKYKIVDEEAKGKGVKILGKGKLTKKLEILVPMSSSARKTTESHGTIK